MSQAPTAPGPQPPSPPARRRPPFWLMLLVLGFVLVPFWFWRGTWFGRPLTEQEMEKYLGERERPRKTQHALVQVGERILRGDPAVKRWYPAVRALAAHEQPQIRATAAWVMGQDNRSEEFHAALLALLKDADPLVRRNAALALVRFGDASGRPELRAMLLPYAVPAPAGGTVDIRLKEEEVVNPGTLLARVRQEGDQVVELRSPLPGYVERWLVNGGGKVGPDDQVVLIAPAEEQAWEALRALYLVGQREDLPLVAPWTGDGAGKSKKVHEQARLTAEAIRRRAAAAGEGQVGLGPG